MSKSKFSTLQTSAQQKTGLEGGNKKSQRHPSTCLRHRYAPQPWVLRNFWLYKWTFSRGCQYSATFYAIPAHLLLIAHRLCPT